MTLGKKIKLLRKLQGLTQRELAESLFVTYQLVSKWERNVSSPTVETLLDMVNIYHLPLDFFNNNSNIEPQISEKEKIFVGFTESMLHSHNDCPTIQSISSLTDISENTIKKYFNTINELIYAYFVYIDKNIKMEVEQKVLINKNILNIFIEDMIPLLYNKRLELHILYTRPYIKHIWVNFIRNKYKALLLMHNAVIDKDDIELEYTIRILITFISTWLSQTNPEPVDKFQHRIKTITSTNINKWPIFNHSAFE